MNMERESLSHKNGVKYFVEILNNPGKLIASAFKGPLTEWADENELKIFSMRDSITWNDEHWQIPYIFLFLYLITLFFVPRIMESREPFKNKNILFWWNVGLCLFSFAGVYNLVPRVLFSSKAGIFKQGYYETICSHPDWFGNGWCGLFMCFFVYSKIYELGDTFWKLLRKSPVSFLHWYHHCTVLIFACHSSKAACSVGVWFCAMNYSVHFIMYGYYAITQTSLKNWAKQWGILITTLQITQMFAGLFIILSAAHYKIKGHECHTDEGNIVFGLLIYASYAVLFINFFIQRWICPQEKKKKNNLN
jgi:elongation of very long chain fatty acids protein 6